MSNGTQRALVWLIPFLLAFCVFISGWSKIESMDTNKQLNALKDNLPKDYVMHSQYDCDINRLYKMLDSMNAKLDKALNPRLDNHN